MRLPRHAVTGEGLRVGCCDCTDNTTPSRQNVGTPLLKTGGEQFISPLSFEEGQACPPKEGAGGGSTKNEAGLPPSNGEYKDKILYFI